MGPPAFTRRQRRHAFALVLAGNGVPVVLALVAAEVDLVRVAGAVAATLVPVVLVARDRRGPARTVLALAGIPALTLLQHDAGGIASAQAVLLIMPAIWFGLQAGRGELLGGLVVLAACCFAPMLVIGAPGYPVAWPEALLVLVVTSAVGAAVASASRETLRATAALRLQASADELSGLLNRRGFFAAGTEALAASADGRAGATLVAFDLDDFKAVNDTLGHAAGDRCISAMGVALRTAFRERDVLGRLGGDEFVALLPRATPDDALRALARLREAGAAPTAFSAGVSGQLEGETLDDLLRRADRALYVAKTAGGGRAVVDGRDGPAARTCRPG